MNDQLAEKIIKLLGEGLEIQKQTLDYMKAMDKSSRKLSVRLEEALAKL